MLEPPDQRMHDGWAGRLRETLERDAFERAWARGRSVTLDEAVEAALGE